MASRYPSRPWQCSHIHRLQLAVWICLGGVRRHGTCPSEPDLSRRDQDWGSSGRSVHLYQYRFAHGESHCWGDPESTERDLLGLAGVCGRHDGGKCILLCGGESSPGRVCRWEKGIESDIVIDLIEVYRHAPALRFTVTITELRQLHVQLGQTFRLMRGPAYRDLIIDLYRNVRKIQRYQTETQDNVHSSTPDDDDTWPPHQQPAA